MAESTRANTRKIKKTATARLPGQITENTMVSGEMESKMEMESTQGAMDREEEASGAREEECNGIRTRISDIVGGLLSGFMNFWKI